jgi:hypothetical protein
MTLNIHHPSPADIDALGEGLTRAVVGSEQASAIRLIAGKFYKSHPLIFYWARRRTFDANQR